ncbi:MAG: AbrB/MazE/SpoVT family DNA-binding domain-containing protein, partial [Clostridia bacterium]|nr:AbrB/MazE/SpoVT family DNA-binding domain-containing protein [Clostridia bacterium]
TGIVRKMDTLGRVVLPMELRKTMDINEGTPLEIYVEGDAIVLRKFDAADALDKMVGRMKKRAIEETEGRKRAKILDRLQEISELLTDEQK